MHSLATKMMRALVLARKGLGQVHPNPLVGALVLDAQGSLAAYGHHEGPGCPHAEAVALKRAGMLAKGGTLLVTLEPCHHKGRTPPCTQAILDAGIARVVYGVGDPNPAVRGGGGAFLASKGLEVVSGVLARSVAKLLGPYLHACTPKNVPYVTLKSAMTLDGKMGDAMVPRVPISSQTCQRTTMRLRQEADAVLVGAQTFALDRPRLTVREFGATPRHPSRHVLASRLSMLGDLSSWDFHQTPWTAWTLDTQMQTPLARQAQDQGLRLRLLPQGTDGHLDLHALLKRLHQDGVGACLVEGGPHLASAFLEAGLVDRWVVYLSENTEVLRSLTQPQRFLGLSEGALDLVLDSAISRGQSLEVWLRRHRGPEALPHAQKDV